MWRADVQDFDLHDVGTSAATAAGVTRVRYIGNGRLIGKRAIGICGSRDATEQSLEISEHFGHFAHKHGFGVVSGNARGVDESAQRGALESGGWTIAVLPEGLANWAPRKAHRPLITSENFAAVSQFDDDQRWQVFRAMERNKLIVALSDALVVVQARTKGGTWEAALAALRQKKPVLVVQRKQESDESGGNQELIGKGAVPVHSESRLCELLEELRSGTLAASQQGRLL